jgi:hypothetical protein
MIQETSIHEDPEVGALTEEAARDKAALSSAATIEKLRGELALARKIAEAMTGNARRNLDLAGAIAGERDALQLEVERLGQDLAEARTRLVESQESNRIACEGQTAALLKAREANDRANEAWDEVGCLRGVLSGTRESLARSRYDGTAMVAAVSQAVQSLGEVLGGSHAHS